MRNNNNNTQTNTRIGNGLLYINHKYFLFFQCITSLFHSRYFEKCGCYCIHGGSVLFRCPVIHDSVTVKQHEQHQGPQTETAGWNSVITNFIIYIFTFPTVTSQNVFSEKKN